MEHFTHYHILNYSFPNDQHVYWSLMIVIYPYITGLVAGAFIVSSLYHVFGKQELKPVAKFSLLTAFGFLLFATVPLLNHLGHPERAFNVMISPNFTSAIAGFGFIYSSYALVLVLEIWFIFRADIVRYSENCTGGLQKIYKLATLGCNNITPEALAIDKKVATFLAAIGIPMACMLHGYVGFLFGAIKANPWWSTPLMPIIFLLSAVVSGIAALILLYAIAAKFMKIKPDENCLRTLVQYLWAFLIADITLELLEILMRFYESAEEWELIHYLLTHNLFGSFVIGQVIICSLIPLIALGFLNLMQVSFKRFYTITLVASCLLVTQVLLMRWNIVIGGQQFSKSFTGFKEYVPHFFDQEGILAAIIIFICPLIVIYILNKLLPNLKEESAEK